MLKYFSADWVFPVSVAPIENGVVSVNEAGEIQEVLTAAVAQHRQIKVNKHKLSLIHI